MSLDAVVVMDDEPDIRKLVIASLRPHLPSVEFFEAEDGDRGLTLVATCVIAGKTVATVVDYMMPKENGLDVYAKISTHYPTVRVALLTGVPTMAKMDLVHHHLTLPKGAFYEKPLRRDGYVALAAYLSGEGTVAHA